MYLPESEEEASLPIFAAFSDVLACVLGIFVLFFVWVVSIEANMADELEHEREERASADDRLRKLESALAGPLSQGLITFADGTIGIRGSVLFDVNSADLRHDGESLLRELATPLSTYLSSRDEVLMVSGFTDDVPIRISSQNPYRDNWELSVHRSVTVVRALIAAGMPAASLFAAGFGENHPVAANDSEQNRAKNRRVELAPVVRPRKSDMQIAPAGDSG
jgi:flagellar motor protein MotB